MIRVRVKSIVSLNFSIIGLKVDDLLIVTTFWTVLCKKLDRVTFGSGKGLGTLT